MGTMIDGTHHITHFCLRELLSWKHEFKIIFGLAPARVGSRTDLQIAAAGPHTGINTAIVRNDEDRQRIR